MVIHTPSTDIEAADIVRHARAFRSPLNIVGGGTRAGLGRPVQAEGSLSTASLIGVTLYEPAEMVIAARAGTPLREVEARLAAHHQALPFEPMDHRRLLGTEGEPTIGAVAACDISGPRRISAGAARDSLIGLRLVNGRGEIVKSGGRVMKNVTGLDLVKLNCGAYGTLGLLTEMTFKVLPRAERIATIIVHGLEDANAVAVLSAALGSPFEVSGAAHLPAGIGADTARTLIRIEHFSTSVEHRLAQLKDMLAPYGHPDIVEGEESADLWGAIRDAEFLAEPRDQPVWRVSVAPTDGPKLIARLPSIGARHFYDWGGGLVWLSLAPGPDAGAAAVRAALASVRGHATLVRAPVDIRAAVAVFEPLAAPLMGLTSGIKTSFDPDRVLNPGRMYAGV